MPTPAKKDVICFKYEKVIVKEIVQARLFLDEDTTDAEKEELYQCTTVGLIELSKTLGAAVNLRYARENAEASRSLAKLLIEEENSKKKTNFDN